MDPSSFHLSPAELYELIGVVGGLGVTGTLGVLFVRRARASRRRQIEEAGDGPPALGREERAAKPARTRDQAPEPRPEPEPRGRERGAAAPARAPEPRAPEARPLPAPSRDAERPAQVIPFPAPEPQPGARPEEARERAGPGLARTRSGFVARLGAVFTGRKQIDPAVVDEIEKVLLTADIGVKTSQKLLEEIRSSLSRSELKDPDAVWAFLRQRSTEMLSLPAADVDFGSAKPFVLLVIGVNGSGKTTTIGKLAARLAGDGKKVLMAAGDTFRAAAVEQLEIWAGRTGAAIVRGKEGADPSSVIFDGIKRGGDRGVRRRDRRYRRPAPYQDRPDAGAAESPAGGRQGGARRAARDLAGHRFDQRAERDRAGADLHRSDGGFRYCAHQAGRHGKGRRHPGYRGPAEDSGALRRHWRKRRGPTPIRSHRVRGSALCAAGKLVCGAHATSG